MKKLNKTLKLALVGVLFCGLLLMGVGAGVAFWEFGSLSYTGEHTMEEVRDYHQHLEFNVEAEDVPIGISLYTPQGMDAAKNLVRVCTSESQTPGTIRLDVDYRSILPNLELDLSTHTEDGAVIRYQLYSYFGFTPPLRVLFAVKDQLLDDLRQDRVGTYYPYDLTAVTISVHPQDAHRIQL